MNYEGVNIVPPGPSQIHDLIVDKSLIIKDSFWFLTDIDFSFLSSKTVRINITVPEYKLAMIDRKAKSMNLSRSSFLVAAAEVIVKMS